MDKMYSLWNLDADVLKMFLNFNCPYLLKVVLESNHRMMQRMIYSSLEFPAL